MSLAICSSSKVLLRLAKRPRVSPFMRLRALFLKIFAACSLFSGTVLVASPNALPAPQERQPTILFVHNPEAAPDFQLQTLDGKFLKLADANGKVVLLNFWATWCGPCRMEIPELIELQKQYKNSLQIISLLVDVDDVEDAKKFVQDAGINYPVAVATDEVRIRYGGVSALPTLFVLDTQGRIVQKHVGLYDARLYELETRALLNLAIPLRVETFEDTGEIFLKNANRATELPGVDLTNLTSEQRAGALRALNAEGCTCGCKLTLAQCRIYDSACHVSKERADKIVTGVSAKPAGTGATTAPTAPRPAAGGSALSLATPEKSPRK
jgi:thiol-disulfide isomerase/thioredoxin